MAKKKAAHMAAVNLRIPTASLKRAADLVAALGDDPAVAGLGAVNRSVVLRSAIAEGLAVLESRYKDGRP